MLQLTVLAYVHTTRHCGEMVLTTQTVSAASCFLVKLALGQCNFTLLLL
jgi:hypothetical protein